MTKLILEECTSSLFRVYPMFRRTVYGAFDSHSVKLTRTQQAILITMMYQQTLSMTELARSINTSNEQATRAVAQLVERGYVKRAQNENNRRVINVSLTEAAEKLIDEVIAIACEQLSARLDGISSAEVKKLTECMGAVGRIMNNDRYFYE